MTPKHLVLAGDSIFDNDTYVPGEAGVIEQLRRSLPPGWSCAKVAIDGACISHVKGQTDDMPPKTTDLIVSVGGNDANGHSQLLWRIRHRDDLPVLLREPLLDFRAAYRRMLDTLLDRDVRLHVCTIYTAIPFEEPAWRQFAPPAIGAFNQVIIEEATARGLNILRLDEVCVDPADFSAMSPIEPSCQGGQKIVDIIISSLKRL